MGTVPAAGALGTAPGAGAPGTELAGLVAGMEPGAGAFPGDIGLVFGAVVVGVVEVVFGVLEVSGSLKPTTYINI